MTPNPVQVIIYDAPAAKAESCACGCGGHHQHGDEDDALAGVGLEMQARALALTLDAAFPGKVQVEYINVLADPRGPRPAPNCAALFPVLPHAAGLHQRRRAVRRSPHPGAHPRRGEKNPGGAIKQGADIPTPRLIASLESGACPGRPPVAA